MGPYGTAETLTRLIVQLKKGREYEIAGGQKISDAMMVSKGITLLSQTATFNKDTREWWQQTN